MPLEPKGIDRHPESAAERPGRRRLAELSAPPPPIQVLVVEDDPGDFRLLEAGLRSSTERFELAHVARLSEALGFGAPHWPEVILLDLSLPDSEGIESLRSIQEAYLGVPILVLTGNDDEGMAMLAVREGAQDYLIKDVADGRSVARAIRYAIERQRLLYEIEQNRQQQLAIKDQFLSHVSHELRTPLASIHDFVSILLDGLAGELTPEQRDYLGVVLKNAKQLRAILSDLSEAFRAQAGKLSVEPACGSTVELVVETVEMLASVAERKSVELEVRLDSFTPAYLGDARRLQEVLVNLIDNAVKYSPEGGRVTVEAGPCPDEADRVRVAVHDTGRGIPPAMTDRIFERLFQANPGDHQARTGLGLGLYICRELLERQNGRIWVRSELGKGSSFFFTVPAYPLFSLLPAAAGTDPLLIAATLRLSRQRPERPATILFGQAYRALQTRAGECGAVLLPRMQTVDGGETFVAAARNDPAHVATLLERIRAELESWRGGQGLDFRVEVTAIPLTSAADSEPTAASGALAMALSGGAALAEGGTVEGKETP